VATLRALVGPDVDDPRLTELVGELSVRSERFRELWSRHDVRPKTCGEEVFHHPQMGTMRLRFEKLNIDGRDGQALLAYHAEPDSESAQKISLLASTVAGDRRKRPAGTSQLTDLPDPEDMPSSSRSGT
jgi:hypothetical protein